MEYFIIVILSFVIWYFIIKFFAKLLKSKFKPSFNPVNNQKEEKDEDYKHYVKKNYLMTNTERKFFFELEKVVQDKYRIIPQVQLSKIVEVNHYEHEKRKFWNKINRKSVDFVLFDKEYLTPQIVIELDDSSHLLPEREKRDYFVNHLIERAGIKIVRVPVAKEYDLTNILN